LGSSMLIPGNKTLLSENTIVNPFNLVTEAKKFAELIHTDYEEILARVFISSKSKIVTPYHALTNQIRELSYSKRGSFGTGVSEVTNISEETGLCLKISDLLDGRYIDILDDLYFYTKNFLSNNLERIDSKELEKVHRDDIDLTAAENRSYIRNCYKNLLASIKLNVINYVSEFSEGKEDIVFEGSQGLLIDRNHGIRPNTTLLDTSNQYGVKLAKELGIEPLKIGLIRAFASRHGLGLLPTYDEELSKFIVDPNQESVYWLGTEPIYGWFDAVLLRYAQMINGNDEYYISCLDQLRGLDRLKICDSYLYEGTVDREFVEIFEYHYDHNKIIITNILKNSSSLKKYLNKAKPIYMEMAGIRNDDYTDYINSIEELTGIKITLLSIGPKRSDKVRRLVR